MMKKEAPSSNLYRQEIERLIPVVHAFHKKANTLRFANFAMALIPVAAVTALTGTVLPVGEALLATSVAAAGITQFARWQKQSLKNHFEKIWQNAETTTRPLLLGFLKGTFETKVGKSANLLSREDFNLRDRPVAMTLLGSCIIGAVYPPMAPIMFFTGTQTREYGDSAEIEKAARGTLEYYNRVQHTPG